MSLSSEWYPDDIDQAIRVQLKSRPKPKRSWAIRQDELVCFKCSTSLLLPLFQSQIVSSSAHCPLLVCVVLSTPYKWRYLDKISLFSSMIIINLQAGVELNSLDSLKQLLFNCTKLSVVTFGTFQDRLPKSILGREFTQMFLDASAGFEEERRLRVDMYLEEVAPRKLLMTNNLGVYLK